MLGTRALYLSMVVYVCISLSLVACASAPMRKGIEVSGLVLRNNTSGAIDNVRIKVEETGGLVSCGHILHNNECAASFPARAYLGQAITVSWVQNGEQWIREALATDTREARMWEEIAMAYVSIYDNGEVKIHFLRVEERPMPATLRH